MEKLTFVVPAYNVENYITKCLESLVRQNSDGYRIIIVNDGSTDLGTERIALDYEGKYPNLVKYIYQENKGLGGARNTGLDLVDTEWVMFLDSDDWIQPDFVELFLHRLKKIEKENVNMIFTLPVCYDHESKCIYDWMDTGLFYEIFNTAENNLVSPSADKRLYDLEVNACRKIYNVSFLRNINFHFQEQVKWEDVYPHYYLLYNANLVCGMSEIGFYYRTNNSSAITAGRGASRLDVVTVFRELFEFMYQQNIENDIFISAMTKLIGFSRWCINMSDIATRGQLVDMLSDFYRSIPKSKKKLYLKSRPQDKRFMRTMQSGLNKKIWKDYYIVSIGEMLDARMKNRRR